MLNMTLSVHSLHTPECMIAPSCTHFIYAGVRYVLHSRLSVFDTLTVLSRVLTSFRFPGCPVAES